MSFRLSSPFVRIGFIFIVLISLSLGSFSQIRMATGTYEGNAIDGTTISGIGFQPDIVIVKCQQTSNEAQIRTSNMPDGLSKPIIGSTALYTTRIKSFTSDGFVVGANTDVNALGKTYYWTAFKGGTDCVVGKYSGDGTVTRNIGGIAFQPDLVILIPATAERAAYRSKSFTDADASSFAGDFNLTKTLTAFTADGFTVGNDPRANKLGTDYYYAAFKSSANSLSLGSYTGNGVDGTVITGVGFKADFMWVKSSSSNLATQKSIQMPNTSSIEFAGSRSDDNRLRDLSNDGFTVGTQGQVNTNNIKYHYVCFRNFEPAPPVTCIATGSYIGDGVIGREITGVGFSPAVVIVKVADNGNEAQIRTNTMPDGYSKQMVGSSMQYTNRINSFTADGFMIGNNADVNMIGKTYYWTAFDVSSVLETGTYIGNGIDSTDITGVSFQPSLVIVIPRGGKPATWRSKTFPNTNCSVFGASFAITKTITALLSNGFRVGNNYNSNKLGEVYHYIAFKDNNGLLSVGSYNGNGIAGTNIPTPGFTVEYMFLKSNKSIAAIQKSSKMPSISTIEFTGSKIDDNRISYMGVDGFTVGNLSSVNYIGSTYHYVAFQSCVTLANNVPLGRAINTAQSNEFSVFPNPANGSFVLKAGSAGNEISTIMLQDLSGKTISSRRVNLSQGNNNFSINVSGLADGLYIVRMIDSKGRIRTSKVMVGK